MRLLLLSSAFLLFASAASAQQLLDARNDNPSYGGYAVGWPSSVIAFRFTATQTTDLTAAQIFTGNSAPAQHSLEIRTRDAATGLPLSLVGQPGTWTTTHTRCWQGAAFAQAAPVVAGQDYFVVWRVQGMFPQHSVSADTEPANVPVETHYSDGNTWHAQALTAGKFRLYGPGASGTNAVYGAGKAGQYGVPTIGLQGWPSLGNPIDVWLDSAARNAIAILVVGFPIPGGAPIGIMDLYASPEILLAYVTKTHTNPLNGGVETSIFVPNDPTWSALPLSFQWAVLDPLAVDGLSHSGGATALIP
ncbi:MAG: hypothetical protein JNK78_17795 [Planctomycetes bacterium]|nr:hypothetical protein [Planctomycetota bacterium]